MTSFEIDRSWATEPLFYRAPAPPGDRQPREYQHAGVEYALARDHCLIGDAPGVGKSCQGVLISNALEARRTLIICPASLRLNWEREVWLWSTTPNVRTYPTLSARDGVSPQAHYQIISYDLLRNEAIREALLALRWDHMILDEAHYLKDPKGNQRTRPICAEDGLKSVVGRITMLSGTILPNQPIECYNAVRLLDWDAIDRMSLEDFRETYYNLGGGFVTVWNKSKKQYEAKWSNRVRNVPTNLDDLRERLRSRIMVRRLKEHVMKELPRRQWHVFPVQSTGAIRRALKNEGWALAERMYEMDPDAFDMHVPVDGSFSTAWRELEESKAPQVADLAEELVRDGRRKLVVGAWHRSTLEYLRGRLEKHGLVYMDGRTSPGAKQRAVDGFQNDPDVTYILGQIQSMGEGWTLTAAQDCLLATPHPVPGKNEQFFDRIHRHGATGEAVTCHCPVVLDTLDERMLGRAVQKDQNIYQALDVRE